MPRRTVRMRLTLLYGGLFLLSGTALLAITYALVVHATGGVVFTGQGGTFVAGPAGDVPGTQMLSNVPGLTVQQIQAQAETMRAQALRQHDAELDQLLTQSGIALAGMAVFSIALGWLVAGRVLRPLRTITRATRRISATSLHERLALSGPDDELKELGDTIDGLLGRLDAAFTAQRRFIANASHELRTPLARQRTLVQLALADPEASTTTLRAAHERVLAANRQQERLIEALLTLARGDAGLDRSEPFDLAQVTEDVLVARESEAVRRGLDLSMSLSPAPAAGDPHLVERLVINLVDNALRHNLDGGHVHVSTGCSQGQAVLTVTNSGPVVAASEVERLLQPFQQARTDHGGGLGLGLSIVHAIATAHAATLTMDPLHDGGLRVTTWFP